MLYFGYGSNLNEAHWLEWCSRCGLSCGPLRAVGPAWLHDHRLIFNRYSYGWSGGVLSIVPCRGAVVQGLLFEITDDQLDALDMKEGVAVNAYRRVKICVEDAAGIAHNAITYQAIAENEEINVDPSRLYLDTVREGYLARGMTLAGLERAEKGKYAADVDKIFVYGTLRKGQSRGDLLLPYEVQRNSARISGRLEDHGAWPALLPALRDQDFVVGEIIALSNVPEALILTDQIEGYWGPSSVKNLFRRSLTEAELADGTSTPCWVYRWAGTEQTGEQQTICSGDWVADQSGTLYTTLKT